ncbi:MAG TPA: DUF4173 domain-containing protein [Candidatus Dormibacteraeota bacterium]|nr:DUF4173 domain-containing protein [Candidatus Dormibacteraeota bacterium]
MSDLGAARVGQLSPDGLWRWDGGAWQPVGRNSPAWSSLELRSSAGWAALLVAIAIGLLADQWLRGGPFGLAASITVGAAAVLLVMVGGIGRSQSRLLLGAAALFAVWFTLRTSPWLIWPDLIASLGVLGLAASFSVRGSLYDLGVLELAGHALHSSLHVATGTAYVVRPIAKARGRLTKLGPALRGLVIAIPIAALLAVLLASADPVFASFFNLNVDLRQLALDVTFVLVGALAMAGLLRLAAAEPKRSSEGPAWRLGATETLVVLALSDTVFAAFALAQVLAATGAAAGTLRSAGISYADYARSGFFQLLWVSGITLVVLFVFSRITAQSGRHSKLALTIFGEAAVVLTVLIVAVAFRRLSLYEEAYGFTMLRLYSHIFAVWIAVVFALLAADLAGLWPRRRWLIGAVGTSGMVVLLALNFANPESVVVALNTKHAESTHRIDATYLSELTSDATPSLLSSLPALDPNLRGQVLSVACAGPRSYSPSLPAFNWADAEAAEARLAGC